jgi:serine protease Do
MKIARSISVLLLAPALLLGACSRGEEPRPPAVVGMAPDFTGLARAIKPSVVNISALDTGGPMVELFYRFFGRQVPEQSTERDLGSGIVIDARRGLILTSFRLIDGSGRIRVTTVDGETLAGEVLKGDESKDLALIRVKPGKKLVAARLGDSRRLEVGERVMAVGNPFGLENTVTVGVVSALGRKDVVRNIRVGLIQTDASINPGNNGGPLVDTRGDVVGINTVTADEGRKIGFAVPINEAKSLYEDFI